MAVESLCHCIIYRGSKFRARLWHATVGHRKSVFYSFAHNNRRDADGISIDDLLHLDNFAMPEASWFDCIRVHLRKQLKLHEKMFSV